jgi:hypothetical protein
VCHVCPGVGCHQGGTAATCTSFTRCSSLVRSTLCLRNEKVCLTTTLITKLLTNLLSTVAVNGGRG